MKLRGGWNALGGVEVLNAVEVVEDVFEAEFKTRNGSGVGGEKMALKLKVAFNFVTKRNGEKVNISRHRVGAHVVEEEVESSISLGVGGQEIGEVGEWELGGKGHVGLWLGRGGSVGCGGSGGCG